jgi:D-alanine--(R)-lactate ligase
MNRLKIGIIFGGSSEEHPVSVKSAQEVARNLDTEKYEPFWIGITKDGAWKLCDGPDENWENSSRPVVLSPDPTVGGLLVLRRGRYEAISLHVVLPVLHGRLGEGGAMQGLLELSGIPYAGCDIQSSALCMDKSLAYIVVRSAGIATPNFRVVTAGETIDPALLTYPVFVKPARSGSSFGVSKVSREDELPNAMKIARQFDSKVLIEEAVVGSEIGCAILGNGTDLIAGETGSPCRTASSGSIRRVGRKTAPRTRHSSCPPTSRRRRACLSKKQQRPYTAPWDAGGCLG